MNLPANDPPAPSDPGPLRCPRCGAAMNRHAVKLVVPDQLEAHHLCPNCGWIQAVRIRP